MRKEFNFDFIGNRKKFFILSLVFMAVAILSTFILGAKIDIQFKGGTILTYVYEGEMNTEEFVSTAKGILGVDMTYTTGTDFTTGKNNIQLSLMSNEGINSDKQFELTNSLVAAYAANNVELIESSDVSPSSGKEFFAKCLVAVACSSVVLIIYIAIRFKNIGGWLAGVCAIITLIHDCVFAYGVFIIGGMSINANFMAVILTILGYSINDTIVIYDRIRENERLYRKAKTRSEIVNLSVNQSLTRSINTSLTTMFSMLSVTIVAAIYGVDSIISFSLPMMFGMLSGVYSSLFIAAPLWAYLEDIRDKKRNEKAIHKKKNA